MFLKNVSEAKPKGMKTRAKWDFIKTFSIPVPSLSEQAEILSVYNSKMAEANAMQASIKLNKKEDIQALIDKLNAFGALELYTNLNLCFNPEYIIIKNFNITFDADYNIEKMSEGNKKLILLNGIYKFLAGKNSLILLDEPDFTFRYYLLFDLVAKEFKVTEFDENTIDKIKKIFLRYNKL